jgi:hypothetical protein
MVENARRAATVARLIVARECYTVKAQARQYTSGAVADLRPRSGHFAAMSV